MALAGGVQAAARSAGCRPALGWEQRVFGSLDSLKPGSAQLSPEQHAASRARKGPIPSRPDGADACPLGSTQPICGTCNMTGP